MPARNVGTTDSIEKRGDWCRLFNPQLNTGNEVIVFRCPVCSADGWAPTRKLNSFLKFLDNIIDVRPHAGALVCSQNQEHRFVLKNKTWKILMKK